MFDSSTTRRAGFRDLSTETFAGDDPLLRHVRTRIRSPQTNGAGTQRLVSYLVRSTPSGNVRVSTRVRFTQLSRAVKNGVPPPTRTGWVTIAYLSISPARMAAAARVAPPMSM